MNIIYLILSYSKHTFIKDIIALQYFHYMYTFVNPVENKRLLPKFKFEFNKYNTA